jgi:DNA repair protein RadC
MVDRDRRSERLVVDRIREMEPSERPRERLLASGPGALSTAELLAVLLRIGRPGRSAVGTGHELLSHFGGLLELARADLRELVRRPGIGPAKAATLAASLELGRRVARVELRHAPPLDAPTAAGTFLVRHLQGRRREVFGFVSLDPSHRYLADHVVTIGTRSQSLVDPGEVYRGALLDGACSIIVFHNHPSGRLEPSRDDLELTRRLAAAGAVLGVPLADHIIVAGSRWLSLRDHDPRVFTTPT